MEVNATIPGAFHHLSLAIVVSFFSISPLSSPEIYIFIILFTFIDLFHKVHSHHTFTFFGFAIVLGQYSYFYRLGETECYNVDDNVLNDAISDDDIIKNYDTIDDDVDMANPFDDDSKIPDDDIEYDQLDEEEDQ